jgi:dTDP-4-dehydrorhamnose 3,5-epimerase
MPFQFTRLELPDVILIEPQVFPDPRGFFMETYKHSDFRAQGINEVFIQGNHSRSSQGVLRGLHYQKQPKGQGKLVRTVAGEIYDVVVDIRKGSPNYAKWVGVSLSSENKAMLYVPPGFAHGFCVTSDVAEILYMATEEYAPAFEAGVIWDDAEININWPIRNPSLSHKDRQWPSLRDADNNFQYQKKISAIGC